MMTLLIELCIFMNLTTNHPTSLVTHGGVGFEGPPERFTHFIINIDNKTRPDMCNLCDIHYQQQHQQQHQQHYSDHHHQQYYQNQQQHHHHHNHHTSSNQHCNIDRLINNTIISNLHPNDPNNICYHTNNDDNYDNSNNSDDIGRSSNDSNDNNEHIQHQQHHQHQQPPLPPSLQPPPIIYNRHHYDRQQYLHNRMKVVNVLIRDNIVTVFINESSNLIGLVDQVIKGKIWL